ncbi:MAG: heat-inducible transcriptional repressor HrcA [Actinomycetota bacterium]|nr:heat-inducible transcriptional repressor HrcA [Actinomycetota bacterium]MEC9270441.1 heat-inducible transcriptional repressor HrcA [Actinomycetota bacterium]
MDERKAAVLRAVVESFIDTAQPVGSRAVSDLSDLRVSAATIRNEMASLEAEGYLAQPHTSAGRVPTDAGYRYFVDRLGPGHLDEAETRQISSFFRHAQGQIEERLADTSRLLSQLTAYAAVVVGPLHDPATVRSAQLVDLGASRLLLVLVTSSGSIERSMIELAPGAAVNPSDIGAASTALNDAFVGASLGTVPTVDPTGKHEVDDLVATTLDALTPLSHQAGELYVGGAANMAGQFDAVSTVKSVLAVLEEQLLVVSLLGDLVERGLSVAIGTETGVAPLSECAVVVAPYKVDGEQIGTIGLLGPTRMDYPKALAAVHVVSSRLGESLGEPHED